MILKDRQASTSTFQTYSDAPRVGVEPWHAMHVRSKVSRQASVFIGYSSSRKACSCTQHSADRLSVLVRRLILIYCSRSPRYLYELYTPIITVIIRDTIYEYIFRLLSKARRRAHVARGYLPQSCIDTNQCARRRAPWARRSLSRCAHR